ncbi:MAG: ribosome maturation factor RimM [bacterium]|nr:ribosome maturation factor RimM [bacterium]
MKYVSVGKILNFHGIQGEAKVGFSKNQEDFIANLKEVFIKNGEKYSPLEIKSVRFNKKFALMKFKGIDSINDLMKYKGALLFIEETYIRENLEENEFLIDELTGLEAYDTEDNLLGVVVGVSNNGVNDFICVKTKNKKTSLVPFVDELVPEVKIKEKKVIINNIEGLLE